MRVWGVAVVWLVAVLVTGAASAATGPWNDQIIVPGEDAEARLVVAVDGAGDLDTLPAGLHLRLPDGWKTYWRSPGDAGLPPVIDWSESRNVAAVDMAWPAPHRFTLFGIDTFGYDGEIVFPLTVTPRRPGEAVALRGVADVLTCSDICVPLRFDLALDVPASAAVPDADIANLIGRFASQVPRGGDGAGVAVTGAAAADGAAPASLQVSAAASEPFASPDVFVEAGDFYAFAAPQVRLSDGGRRLTADLPVLQWPSDDAGLVGRAITVTLVDGGRAIEETLTVEPWQAPAAAEGRPAWPVVLGLALLGGLILNLMPCVLPVLSLKLLSIVSHGGRSAALVRRGFLASAAGILASFCVLAAAAIAVKATGGAVGWGVQFQQPAFLVFMVVVVTLFASNLFGLFEIPLPTPVADLAGRFGSGDGIAGHFATGVFATLLATPCSAPFLGTAVGFALSQGPLEILAVFLALGVGLALPYLAVAAVPRLVAWLPRPGRWMVWLRRLLGLALVATAVWLLAVLAVLTSATAAYVVAGLMLGIGVLLGARRAAGGLARAGRGVGIVALVVLAFAVPALVQPVATASAPAVPAAWQPFDRTGIPGQVAEGRVVFVDVTADWCITCQANKALVLDRGDVAQALRDPGVVPMLADWTRPDPGISAYLAEYGRYGIPFYAVYGPAAPQGLPLPEVLTESIVLDALRRAGLES